MSGYISLNTTGEPVIDSILAALEEAGDGYHHTRDWTEDLGDGTCYMDRIQRALDLAAFQIRAMRSRYDEERRRGP